MPTVMSVFGVEPFRIGGTETFARELSSQLAQAGWQSVLCFQSEPPADVRTFLERDNVTFEILRDSPQQSWKSLKDFVRAVRRHRPEILHLHFTGFLGLFPWLARLLSVKKIFFTDHTSRPAGYVPRRAPAWKRMLARSINAPITKVVCVSRYGYQCLTALDLLPADRYELVYNAVDLSRVHFAPERAAEFRRQNAIPADRIVVLQVSWIIPEKGIPDLLKAASIVVARNRKVQFVFVGEGAYRYQYMKETEIAGLEDNVSWTGLVEDPRRRCLRSRRHCVSGFELGRSLWLDDCRGYVVRKPIVATRVGGIPNLLQIASLGILWTGAISLKWPSVF